MSNHREAQVRLERKRRRREERRKRRRGLVQSARPAASSLEEEWSLPVFLTPDGRPPDPDRVAAFAALGTMSDALLRLMEPYVWWPPHPSEIEDLEAWLELGAAVWNATIEATTAEQLREKLRAIVADEDLSDEEDPIGLVEEIATRKLQLLAHDYRRVVSVKVRAEGGRATVQALTTAHLR